MKFLYKIWSGYDGFSPREIPNRLIAGKDLQLGWMKYLDSVEKGDEVWIYFYGPHKFTPGVYVEGFVRSVDVEKHGLLLRVRKSATDAPLTDVETSARVGEVVAVKNRQVFLYPDKWETAPRCTLHTMADSCAQHRCGKCSTWQSLPIIHLPDFNFPHRLPKNLIAGYAPAYWVIPSRCYLHKVGTVASIIKHTSNMFMRFKVGEETLAYPLALGMYHALLKQDLLDFDAVIPIPLSPDKETAGEINRTQLLARDLAKLLGAKPIHALTLSQPISKHRLRTHAGLSASAFESRYSAALKVDHRIKDLRKLLLVDDVCTEGSTLSCAVRAVRSVNQDATITITTAGQMIMKASVRDEQSLLDPGAAVA